MKTHKREILIYYNADSSSDRKTIAHARGVTAHLKSYEFKKAPSSSTSWQMILSSLDIHPKDLLNKAHPYYREHIKGKEFNEEDWISCLQRNPELIKAPIAIRGHRAILCNNPTDIYRLI